MNKTLVNVIKDIIEKQAQNISPVANLQGPPIVFDDRRQEITATGNWRVYSLNTKTLDSVDILSPDELINRITTFQIQSSPTIQSIEGVLVFPAVEGTVMASTVIQIPQALGFDVNVFAPGKNIAIYSHENLVRRGVNELSTTINFPAGNTPLHIVTAGAVSTNVVVQIPSDINTTINTFVPPQPQWLSSGALLSNYVDPKTGGTGIALRWYNQENVGGWGVYRVETQDFGIVTSASSVGGRYILHTNFSGTVPYIGTVTKVGPYYLGPVENSYYDDNENRSIITVKAVDNGDRSFNIISGTLQILSFVNLGEISKATNDTIITYSDTNVKTGQRYFYTIDSYSPVDNTIRSDKTQVVNLVAGDIFPPGPITLNSVTVDGNKRLTVNYRTPIDEDYYATKAVFYFQGSGTGTVSNVNYITDVGFSNTLDSMIVPGITSGTFYFITSDILGNTQYIFSGVPFYWNGSGQANAGINTPPTISIAQLSSSEMGSLNPRLLAQFRLSASDAETPGSTVIQYKINSGTADPWITAPSNPFTATLGIQNRDGWILARAFDGTYFSDELIGLADFDSTPEISSVYARYIVSSGIMFVTGTVDDDTKSIKWYIDNGAEAGDPTSTSATLVDNLTSNKTFNFSFAISDGQRKILKIIPYPLLGGTGTTGNSHTEEIIRLPRTTTSVSERSVGGAVTRVNTIVTLSSSPEDATIFNRTMPIDYGIVTSGTANTLTDNSQSWTINQFATNWEAKIVKGKGLNQSRTITSNDAKTLVVSPNWLVVPDSTSEYYVNEKFKHYSDRGKVTSAGQNFITDTTKNWITNEFVNKTIHIYSGLGVFQESTIISGTSTTVSFSPGMTIIPNSTSGYAIFGPLVVTKDQNKETTVEYYSTINNLTEEVQSLILDSDTVPEIASGTITLTSTNTLLVKITGVDEDAKYWKLWLRKNNWPTIVSGSAEAALNDDYLRWTGSTDVKQLTFTAGTGWWYGVAVPSDSYSNYGPRIIFSGENPVIPPTFPAPAITYMSIDRHDRVSPQEDYNRIWWYHNVSCEKPGGGNGNITVRIYWYSENLGPWTEEELTDTGGTRFAWQDSESGSTFTNTDDTTNVTTGYGSYLHRVFRAHVKNEGVWDNYHYRVQLFSGTTFFGESNSEEAGYYNTILF